MRASHDENAMMSDLEGWIKLEVKGFLYGFGKYQQQYADDLFQVASMTALKWLRQVDNPADVMRHHKDVYGAMYDWLAENHCPVRIPSDKFKKHREFFLRASADVMDFTPAEDTLDAALFHIDYARKVASLPERQKAMWVMRKHGKAPLRVIRDTFGLSSITQAARELERIAKRLLRLLLQLISIL